MTLKYVFYKCSYMMYYFYLKYLDDCFDPKPGLHTCLKSLLNLRKHKLKRKCGLRGKDEVGQLNLLRSKDIYVNFRGIRSRL